jgi:molybdopterin-containing oxidoreductase family iron-sulfur binding subunit
VYPAAGGGAPFEAWWHETLQAGFVSTTPQSAAAPALLADGLDQLTFAEPTFAGDAAGQVLVVYPSYKYYDGRMANRPWLQELPDPVSKFCWSSWVEIHPETAEQLGVDTGHIVEVSTPTGSVAVPAWRNPATRPDVIAMALGQGHEALGSYAAGRGANPMRLLDATADALSGGLVWQQARATITPTGRWERPIKQGLQDEQYGREIARAWDLAESRQADASRGLTVIGGAGVATAEPAEPQEEEHAGGHAVDVHPQDAHVSVLQGAAGWAPVEMDASPAGYPPPGTWYGEYSQAQPRWGMVVDLDRCIGCSACITACYAENNIGIAGPELVANGRIMHWIRIERYFEVHEGESLQTRFLPMMCQQCGNAPCEPVCPVYASYHTPDGLNAQVYNRCVGTRYCANNCPYKVRTYNWFTYEFPSPLHWQLNPDVTVREKGVMEKCTFCVQRIRDAENHARLEDRGVRDGEITPACAQTCPGNAIVFGNLRDPQSRVARAAASGRGYRVLEQLNTQSAITYLRKVEGSEA